MNWKENFTTVFEAELLKLIEEKASLTSVEEGTVLIDVGQIVRVMPLLLEGTIKITRIDESGNEILLYYIQAMESCAMTFTCCMQQFPSEIKATAESDITFLAIPIASMDEWMMKFPSWKSFVMKTIRNRFNELLLTIDQIAFQNLDDRLVHYLKEKSKNTGSSLINLTHEQIATDLASSRVVISRLLKKLENQQKLLLYRNQIKILKAM